MTAFAFTFTTLLPAGWAWPERQSDTLRVKQGKESKAAVGLEQALGVNEEGTLHLGTVLSTPEVNKVSPQSASLVPPEILPPFESQPMVEPVVTAVKVGPVVAVAPLAPVAVTPVPNDVSLNEASPAIPATTIWQRRTGLEETPVVPATGVTRRTFLKASAVLAAGVAVGGGADAVAQVLAQQPGAIHWVEHEYGYTPLLRVIYDEATGDWEPYDVSRDGPFQPGKKVALRKSMRWRQLIEANALTGIVRLPEPRTVTAPLGREVPLTFSESFLKTWADLPEDVKKWIGHPNLPPGTPARIQREIERVTSMMNKQFGGDALTSSPERFQKMFEELAQTGSLSDASEKLLKEAAQKAHSLWQQHQGFLPDKKPSWDVVDKDGKVLLTVPHTPGKGLRAVEELPEVQALRQKHEIKIKLSSKQSSVIWAPQMPDQRWWPLMFAWMRLTAGFALDDEAVPFGHSRIYLDLYGLLSPKRPWKPEQVRAFYHEAALQGIEVVSNLGSPTMSIHPDEALFLVRDLVRQKIIHPDKDGVVRFSFDIEPHDTSTPEGREYQDLWEQYKNAPTREAKDQAAGEIATRWENVMEVAARTQRLRSWGFRTRAKADFSDVEVTLFVPPNFHEVWALAKGLNPALKIPKGVRLAVMPYNKDAASIVRDLEGFANATKSEGVLKGVPFAVVANLDPARKGEESLWDNMGDVPQVAEELHRKLQGTSFDKEYVVHGDFWTLQQFFLRGEPTPEVKADLGLRMWVRRFLPLMQAAVDYASSIKWYPPSKYGTLDKRTPEQMAWDAIVDVGRRFFSGGVATGSALAHWLTVHDTVAYSIAHGRFRASFNWNAPLVDPALGGILGGGLAWNGATFGDEAKIKQVHRVAVDPSSIGRKVILRDGERIQGWELEEDVTMDGRLYPKGTVVALGSALPAAVRRHEVTLIGDATGSIFLYGGRLPNPKKLDDPNSGTIVPGRIVVPGIDVVADGSSPERAKNDSRIHALRGNGYDLYYLITVENISQTGFHFIGNIRMTLGTGFGEGVQVESMNLGKYRMIWNGRETDSLAPGESDVAILSVRVGYDEHGLADGADGYGVPADRKITDPARRPGPLNRHTIVPESIQLVNVAQGWPEITDAVGKTAYDFVELDVRLHPEAYPGVPDDIREKLQAQFRSRVQKSIEENNLSAFSFSACRCDKGLRVTFTQEQDPIRFVHDHAVDRHRHGITHLVVEAAEFAALARDPKVKDFLARYLQARDRAARTGQPIDVTPENYATLLKEIGQDSSVERLRLLIEEAHRQGLQVAFTFDAQTAGQAKEFRDFFRAVKLLTEEPEIGFGPSEQSALNLTVVENFGSSKVLDADRLWLATLYGDAQAPLLVVWDAKSPSSSPVTLKGPGELVLNVAQAWDVSGLSVDQALSELDKKPARQPEGWRLPMALVDSKQLSEVRSLSKDEASDVDGLVKAIQEAATPTWMKDELDQIRRYRPAARSVPIDFLDLRTTVGLRTGLLSSKAQEYSPDSTRAFGKLYAERNLTDDRLPSLDAPLLSGQVDQDPATTLTEFRVIARSPGFYSSKETDVPLAVERRIVGEPQLNDVAFAAIDYWKGHPGDLHPMNPGMENRLAMDDLELGLTEADPQVVTVDDKRRRVGTHRVLSVGDQRLHLARSRAYLPDQLIFWVEDKNGNELQRPQAIRWGQAAQATVPVSGVDVTVEFNRPYREVGVSLAGHRIVLWELSDLEQAATKIKRFDVPPKAVQPAPSSPVKGPITPRLEDETAATTERRPPIGEIAGRVVGRVTQGLVAFVSALGIMNSISSAWHKAYREVLTDDRSALTPQPVYTRNPLKWFRWDGPIMNFIKITVITLVALYLLAHAGPIAGLMGFGLPAAWGTWAANVGLTSWPLVGPSIAALLGPATWGTVWGWVVKLVIVAPLLIRWIVEGVGSLVPHASNWVADVPHLADPLVNRLPRAPIDIRGEVKSAIALPFALLRFIGYYLKKVANLGRWVFRFITLGALFAPVDWGVAHAWLAKVGISRWWMVGPAVERLLQWAAATSPGSVALKGTIAGAIWVGAKFISGTPIADLHPAIRWGLLGAIALLWLIHFVQYGFRHGRVGEPGQPDRPRFNYMAVLTGPILNLAVSGILLLALYWTFPAWFLGWGAVTILQALKLYIAFRILRAIANRSMESGFEWYLAVVWLFPLLFSLSGLPWAGALVFALIATALIIGALRFAMNQWLILPGEKPFNDAKRTLAEAQIDPAATADQIRQAQQNLEEKQVSRSLRRINIGSPPQVPSSWPHAGLVQAGVDFFARELPTILWAFWLAGGPMKLLVEAALPGGTLGQWLIATFPQFGHFLASIVIPQTIPDFIAGIVGVSLLIQILMGIRVKVVAPIWERIRGPRPGLRTPPLHPVTPPSAGLEEVPASAEPSPTALDAIKNRLGRMMTNWGRDSLTQQVIEETRAEAVQLANGELQRQGWGNVESFIRHEGITDEGVIENRNRFIEELVNGFSVKVHEARYVNSQDTGAELMEGPTNETLREMFRRLEGNMRKYLLTTNISVDPVGNPDFFGPNFLYFFGGLGVVIFPLLWGSEKIQYTIAMSFRYGRGFEVPYDVTILYGSGIHSDMENDPAAFVSRVMGRWLGGHKEIVGQMIGGQLFSTDPNTLKPRSYMRLYRGMTELVKALKVQEDPVNRFARNYVTLPSEKDYDFGMEPAVPLLLVPQEFDAQEEVNFKATNMGSGQWTMSPRTPNDQVLIPPIQFRVQNGRLVYSGMGKWNQVYRQTGDSAERGSIGKAHGLSGSIGMLLKRFDLVPRITPITGAPDAPKVVWEVMPLWREYHPKLEESQKQAEQIKRRESRAGQQIYIQDASHYWTDKVWRRPDEPVPDDVEDLGPRIGHAPYEGLYGESLQLRYRAIDAITGRVSAKVFSLGNELSLPGGNIFGPGGRLQARQGNLRAFFLKDLLPSLPYLLGGWLMVAALVLFVGKFVALPAFVLAFFGWVGGGLPSWLLSGLGWIAQNPWIFLLGSRWVLELVWRRPYTETQFGWQKHAVQAGLQASYDPVYALRLTERATGQQLPRLKGRFGRWWNRSRTAYDYTSQADYRAAVNAGETLLTGHTGVSTRGLPQIRVDGALKPIENLHELVTLYARTLTPQQYEMHRGRPVAVWNFILARRIRREIHRAGWKPEEFFKVQRAILQMIRREHLAVGNPETRDLYAGSHNPEAERRGEENLGPFWRQSPELLRVRAAMAERKVPLVFEREWSLRPDNPEPLRVSTDKYLTQKAEKESPVEEMPMEPQAPWTRPGPAATSGLEEHAGDDFNREYFGATYEQPDTDSQDQVTAQVSVDAMPLWMKVAGTQDLRYGGTMNTGPDPRHLGGIPALITTGVVWLLNKVGLLGVFGIKLPVVATWILGKLGVVKVLGFFGFSLSPGGAVVALVIGAFLLDYLLHELAHWLDSLDRLDRVVPMRWRNETVSRWLRTVGWAVSRILSGIAWGWVGFKAALWAKAGVAAAGAGWGALGFIAPVVGWVVVALIGVAVVVLALKGLPLVNRVAGVALSLGFAWLAVTTIPPFIMAAAAGWGIYALVAHLVAWGVALLVALPALKAAAESVLVYRRDQYVHYGWRGEGVRSLSLIPGLLIQRPAMFFFTAFIRTLKKQAWFMGGATGMVLGGWWAAATFGGVIPVILFALIGMRVGAGIGRLLRAYVLDIPWSWDAVLVALRERILPGSFIGWVDYLEHPLVVGTAAGPGKFLGRLTAYIRRYTKMDATPVPVLKASLLAHEPDWTRPLSGMNLLWYIARLMGLSLAEDSQAMIAWHHEAKGEPALPAQGIKNLDDAQYRFEEARDEWGSIQRALMFAKGAGMWLAVARLRAGRDLQALVKQTLALSPRERQEVFASVVYALEQREQADTGARKGAGVYKYLVTAFTASLQRMEAIGLFAPGEGLALAYFLSYMAIDGHLGGAVARQLFQMNMEQDGNPLSRLSWANFPPNGTLADPAVLELLLGRGAWTPFGSFGEKGGWATDPRTALAAAKEALDHPDIHGKAMKGVGETMDLRNVFVRIVGGFFNKQDLWPIEEIARQQPVVDYLLNRNKHLVIRARKEHRQRFKMVLGLPLGSSVGESQVHGMREQLHGIPIPAADVAPAPAATTAAAVDAGSSAATGLEESNSNAAELAVTEVSTETLGLTPLERQLNELERVWTPESGPSADPDEEHAVGQWLRGIAEAPNQEVGSVDTAMIAARIRWNRQGGLLKRAAQRVESAAASGFRTVNEGPLPQLILFKGPRPIVSWAPFVAKMGAPVAVITETDADADGLTKLFKELRITTDYAIESVEFQSEAEARAKIEHRFPHDAFDYWTIEGTAAAEDIRKTLERYGIAFTGDLTIDLKAVERYLGSQV